MSITNVGPGRKTRVSLNKGQKGAVKASGKQMVHVKGGANASKKVNAHAGSISAIKPKDLRGLKPIIFIPMLILLILSVVWFTVWFIIPDFWINLLGYASHLDVIFVVIAMMAAILGLFGVIVSAKMSDAVKDAEKRRSQSRSAGQL